VVVVPHNRRRRKRGVRVISAPNPCLSRGNLANETARAAEREGINVSDDVLHELRKCIKRGGGSNLSISRLHHDITEFLLMYLRVYRQRPSAKKSRQDLEKILKAIGRLQRAMPRANDPTYRLLFDRRFKSRLIADLDPDEWDLPPKPKWMRWATYNRYVARYDHYESIRDYGCVAFAAKLGKDFFK
jgi:hypothetical protein